jgi:hypothetical protein
MSDAGMAQNHRFDLSQLDPVAANLDLAIAPAEELDQAVAPAPHVAGPVQSPAGLVGYKRRGGARAIAPIAVGEAGSADVKLALDPVRTWPHVGVEHMERLVRHQPPVGYAAPGRIKRSDLVTDRPYRRFGGTTEAEQRDIWCGGGKCRRQTKRDPIAAQHGKAQARQRSSGRFGRQQQVKKHRHRVPKA